MTESLLLVTMLYFQMPTLFGNVEYSYSSFFNIIEAFYQGYCLMQRIHI